MGEAMLHKIIYGIGLVYFIALSFGAILLIVAFIASIFPTYRRLKKWD